MMKASLSVREIQTEDVKPIIDYWSAASPEYLRGMGVDSTKMPSREEFTNNLNQQILSAYEDKMAYAIIWLIDGVPVGHNNVNKIEFGDSAFMHLHLWNPQDRRNGAGAELVKLTLPYFFENLKLKTLYCEPYALNPAPHKTLAKVGFELEKIYTTIPGVWNFEQEVNRWKLTKENFEKMRVV